MDNIGAGLAPVWRARKRAPFTIGSVRAELLAQAMELPEEWQQQAYLDARLSDLDKALNAEESEAVEKWLLCEELLQGRPASIGDGGGGSGRSSLLADDAMEALAEHAEIKARLNPAARKVLARLAQMMDAPQWTMDARFVEDVHKAAAKLTKLHMC